MKTIISLVVAFLISATSFGQILTPVKWSYASKKINDTEAVLFIKATIEKGWLIYSQTVPEGGPEPTVFSFDPSNEFQLKGKTIAPNPEIKYDPTFRMKIGYHQKSVVFQQRVNLLAGSTVVKGMVTFMVCNDLQCLPPEEVKFSIPVN